MTRESVTWGLDNPHSLSRTKTELVWEGKCDEFDNQRPVLLHGDTFHKDRHSGIKVGFIPYCCRVPLRGGQVIRPPLLLGAQS